LLQLKLDQRKRSEGTRQHELNQRKIRIDTIIYDANNVLKEFHRDQEYHVNGSVGITFNENE
jgi:hypothetical protein